MNAQNEPAVAGRIPHVVVIGGGIGGILAGIKLKEKGYSFTILEKAGALGGTWRDNTYPGVACDDPAHLYVYSFEPNPDWKSVFAAGKDILNYYQRAADKYGITPHVRFHSHVVAAEWRDDHWNLELEDGSRLRADIVVSAVGRLHHPSLPEIPGMETFERPLFHSARWDHGVDVRNKRIGVIGTGSSATQITAAVSKTAARLLLFQRTPQWVLTVPNDPVPAWFRFMLKYVPFVGKWYYRRLKKQVGDAAKALLAGDREAYDARIRACLEEVRDPALRAKLTPSYAPGCKRLCNSPDFYKAIQRPNVELVTEGIERIAPTGIVTSDGKLHELDALVLATGFKTHAFLRPMKLTGKDGVTLDSLWADGFVNYRTVALPHMPNFFMVNGPYSPSSSGSIVPIIEIDMAYIMQCIERIRVDRVALAPSYARSVAWLEGVRKRASKTVWATGGCSSWYLDKQGVPVNYPAARDEFALELDQPNYADFEVFPLDGSATVATGMSQLRARPMVEP